MRKVLYALHLAIFMILACSSAVHARDTAEPLIIDHTRTRISTIPVEWIEQTKDNRKLYYTRQSHGMQLNQGLYLIEQDDPFYDATWPNPGYLPEVEDALCIRILNADHHGFWRGSGLQTTRNVLDGTPEINVAGFSWCTQLDGASEGFVDEYLDAMSTLESEYPGVTFVYMTGTSEHGGSYGYNRHLRNEQIRQYCIDNNKVLYDFADIDSWWYDTAAENWEQATYEYNGHTIPVEHPQLAGNDAYHTSCENCEQKGKAAWWMMAVLEGWQGSSTDVAITSFSGEYRNGVVELSWSVGQHDRPDGYNIYRSEDGGMIYSMINGALIPAGGGNRFKDANIVPGRTYRYRLAAVEGSAKYESMIIIVSTTSEQIGLFNNCPNPFNPTTTITFHLNDQHHCTLRVYDVQGRCVKTLCNGNMNRGSHNITWDGTSDSGNRMGSGVYFYRLQAGKKVLSRKMLLLR